MRLPRFVFFLLILALFSVTGCQSLRSPTIPIGPSISVATYNVNFGNHPEALVQTLKSLDADIVCLQEADGFESAFRSKFASSFPVIQVLPSTNRPGGGYAFLSKYEARKTVVIPSAEWFDGWIMVFETHIGSLQILNLHLHPPIKRGSWIYGYLFTRSDRLREIQEFHAALDPNLPTLIVGDFNDTSNSRAVRYLQKRGFKNALPQFDRRSPTWQWQTRFLRLRRRMDHILFNPLLQSHSAQVLQVGQSDHFPVMATFSKSIDSTADRGPRQ